MLKPRMLPRPHLEARPYWPCAERTADETFIEMVVVVRDPPTAILQAIVGEVYDEFDEMVELFRPSLATKWSVRRRAGHISWDTGRLRSVNSDRDGLLAYLAEDSSPRQLSVDWEIPDASGRKSTNCVLDLDVTGWKELEGDPVALEWGGPWTRVHAVAFWVDYQPLAPQLSTVFVRLFQRLVGTHLDGMAGAAWFNCVPRENTVDFRLIPGEGDEDRAITVLDPAETLPGVQYATWIPSTVRSRFEAANGNDGPYDLVEVGTQLVAYLREDLWSPREEVEAAAAAIISSLDPRWVKLHHYLYCVATD